MASDKGASLPRPSVQVGDIQIRRAVIEDLPALATLLAQCFNPLEMPWDWLYPLMRFSIQEDLRLRLKQPSQDYACWVAVQVRAAGTASPPGEMRPAKFEETLLEETLVGTVELTVRAQRWLAGLGGTDCFSQAMLQWAVSGPSGSPYLSNLAVCRTVRRQGIARRLLTTCRTFAQTQGYQDLYLHVLENNQPARQLYTQLGYRFQRVDPSWEEFFWKRPSRLLLRQSIRDDLGD